MADEFIGAKLNLKSVCISRRPQISSYTLGVSPTRRQTSRRTPGGAGSRRTKRRAQILATATELFAAEGFAQTRWTSVAAELGLDKSALYYYFESKHHCLYEIMRKAIGDFTAEFAGATADEPFEPGFRGFLTKAFDLGPDEVAAKCVMVGEVAHLRASRRLPREEQARRLVIVDIRILELDLAAYFERAMDEQLIAPSDPRLLSRSVLGLYNSVWLWYRRSDRYVLDDLADFFVPRILNVVGPTVLLPARP